MDGQGREKKDLAHIVPLTSRVYRLKVQGEKKKQAFGVIASGSAASEERFSRGSFRYEYPLSQKAFFARSKSMPRVGFQDRFSRGQ